MEGNAGETTTREALDVEIGGRRFTVEDLAHVNRMMTVGLVLPNAAHEVNNALQVAGGLVEILAAREDMPEGARERLGRISAQLARATGIVRELVAYTRREQAGAGRVDVGRAVEAALSMRRYHLSRARIKVTTNVVCDLPAVCVADGHYLQQSLVNLIINAEQALKDQPDPCLEVSVSADAAHVVVTVQDNGRGLAEDAAARACEPFFSTSATRLGLGLAVARALAERDGGQLSLEADRSRGTKVTLGLPRA